MPYVIEFQPDAVSRALKDHSRRFYAGPVDISDMFGQMAEARIPSQSAPTRRPVIDALRQVTSDIKEATRIPIFFAACARAKVDELNLARIGARMVYDAPLPLKPLISLYKAVMG